MKFYQTLSQLFVNWKIGGIGGSWIKLFLPEPCQKTLKIFLHSVFAFLNWNLKKTKRDQ